MPSIPNPITQLLSDVARCGIVLELATGDNIRFRPRNRMTPELAERLKDHKVELLAILRETPASGSDTTDVSGPGHEPNQAVPTYTSKERTLLEPAPHELRQTVAQIKGIFGDICTPTVTDVQVVPHKPRCQAARLIRSARREGHHDQAIALRDAWRERIAFCTVDGGMVQEAAERVAASELEGLHTHDENYFGAQNTA